MAWFTAVLDWSRQYIGTILGICTFVTVVIGAYKKGFKPWYAKKAAPFMAGLSSIQQLPQVVHTANQWKAMEKTILEIASQFRPNGGSTVLDKLDRVEQHVTILTDTLRANLDGDASRALYECSSDGRIIWVNRTYCRWLNCSEDELLGFRFLAWVPIKERELVRLEWERARIEARPYKMEHTLARSDGSEIRVDVMASPIPANGPPVRWVGVMRLLSEQQK